MLFLPFFEKTGGRGGGVEESEESGTKVSRNLVISALARVDKTPPRRVGVALRPPARLVVVVDISFFLFPFPPLSLSPGKAETETAGWFSRRFPVCLSQPSSSTLQPTLTLRDENGDPDT